MQRTLFTYFLFYWGYGFNVLISVLGSISFIVKDILRLL